MPERIDAWRAWVRDAGTLTRDLREYLGLSQDQLAKIANLSQGSLSRFERSGALSTPWLVVVKLRLALTARLRQLDADVLPDAARRFLEQSELLGAPEGFAPRNDTIARLPALDATGIVRAYRQVPESGRAQFVAIMSGVVTALADRKA